MITYLALGSNIEARQQYLERAHQALAHYGTITKQSSVRETEPILRKGSAPQAYYLNQVLEFETTLAPKELLHTIKIIERKLGRKPRERWGPREIDIDILLYENVVLDTVSLQIPHPELKNRPFIKELLQEIRFA